MKRKGNTILKNDFVNEKEASSFRQFVVKVILLRNTQLWD